MKKTLTITLMALALLFTSGCSSQTVPQGTKGKVLDRGGFHPEVFPPSRVNVGMHGHLILVDTTTHTVNETITIRMHDNMNLVAQVRFQLRMGNKQKSLNAVFNDIKPADGTTISLEQVYNTYGKLVVNKVVREVMSPYNIGDVNKNFNKISAAIYKQIAVEFKPTPLAISDVALGKLDYPEIIDAAIQAAAKRELEIKTAEADVQVKLTELQGREKLAEGNYRIKMAEAKRIRDYNRMIGSSVSPELLALRKLEVQEAMVNSIKGNSNVVYMPMEMMGSSQNMRMIK